jgi:hypothetical protein
MIYLRKSSGNIKKHSCPELWENNKKTATAQNQLFFAGLLSGTY